MGDGVSGAVVGSNPRGRGDDYELDTKKPHPREQPPRARGRHLDHGDHVRGGRATPAGAGTTTWPRCPRWCSASNPRGRGDGFGSVHSGQSSAEQPPRARGRPAEGAGSAEAVGATPAGAGTTQRLGGRRVLTQSNPRGRGDDKRMVRPPRTSLEQPPRARGRRTSASWCTSRSGATPAGAGTTSSSRRCCPTPGSNPRGRGDDDFPAPLGPTRAEQPPRARGRPGRGEVGVRGRGATPAGAGTTRHVVDAGLGDGEQPPRARGRHWPGYSDDVVPGATPAGAGTTRTYSGTLTPAASNPRGRGDDCTDSPNSVSHGEQPPRARGRPSTLTGWAASAGATPAGAGTTAAASNPRGRGDDAEVEDLLVGNLEQPPRARGRRRGRGSARREPGATPAGAGTTRSG